MQQQETKKTRRIRQVSVTNLFGIFNHTIPLKMDEHITIIHGPNGFGKTVMLKLLHALFSQNPHYLQNIPFKAPSWLIDMRNSVPIRFIETQRLLSSRRPFRSSLE